MAFFTSPAGSATIGAVAVILSATISALVISKTNTQRMKADADIAERRLIREAEIADARRKLELAEKVVADIYEIRDIFMRARMLSSTPGAPFVPDGFPETIGDWARGPLDYLQQHGDTLFRFMAREYEFAALFGGDSRGPFRMIDMARRSVENGVRDLLLEYKFRKEPFISEARYIVAVTDAFKFQLPNRDHVDSLIDKAVSMAEESAALAAAATRYKAS